MTRLLLAVLSLPCVYWTQGLESRPQLEAAGIKQLCVAPDRAAAWRAAGFSVSPIPDAELASREALPAPGVTARAGLASPTRAPWIVANGWRFTRAPGARYVYDVPAGKAALAAAEAFAYGADAILKIDPSDLKDLGTMLAFLEALPAADLPSLADLAVVDDGSAVTGEVMNLLARRNLLFDAVKTPSPRYRINVAVGTRDYPVEDAADPSAFALKIRRQLTDEQRTLRVYGSEVVLAAPPELRRARHRGAANPPPWRVQRGWRVRRRRGPPAAAGLRRRGRRHRVLASKDRDVRGCRLAKMTDDGWRMTNDRRQFASHAPGGAIVGVGGVKCSEAAEPEPMMASPRGVLYGLITVPSRLRVVPHE
ncbi:MAG: hypothetical protein DMF86_01200 [Acidobacteria bacterium]|nr:MAG: hypothetical protein DMF86_01200 [Acidobacteriota bacterium]